MSAAHTGVNAEAARNGAINRAAGESRLIAQPPYDFLTVNLTAIMRRRPWRCKTVHAWQTGSKFWSRCCSIVTGGAPVIWAQEDQACVHCDSRG
jgi:hypothetical protein